MALDVGPIMRVIGDHARQSGLYDYVSTHEPKAAPQGPSYAVWLQRIRPARTQSGLSSATAHLVFNARIYTNMLAEPQDGIDLTLSGLLNDLFNRYIGDFTLGGTVKQIDMMGQEGIDLEATAGYINQDGKMLRVFTITVPVIVNDAWDEEA